MATMIEAKGLTKDYGDGKGIFDINISVEKGEVFGFLGPNGAGKTTTIRHFMGFIKPDKGSATMEGRNCFLEREIIQKSVGYLPGEISCMDEMTGDGFLNFIAAMKGVSDRKKIEELKEYFELDSKGKIRKMSKGNKQKIGIICAFMDSPDILILDEPTSGLDPLMQNRFTELVLEEKRKGKTIFLSSHIFEEVEKTCDRTAFIRNGKIAAVENMEDLRKNKNRIYCVKFDIPQEKEMFMANHQNAVDQKDHVEISILGNVDPFIKELGEYSVGDLFVKTQSLEDIFLHMYGGEDHE